MDERVIDREPYLPVSWTEDDARRTATRSRLADRAHDAPTGMPVAELVRVAGMRGAVEECLQAAFPRRRGP